MLLPLKDIYAYLQFNQYLLRALLHHNSYKLFEKEVVDMKIVTKTLLYNLFDKYFILADLKSKANDIIKYDILHKKR